MIRQLIWDLTGKTGTQFIYVITALALTRILNPEVFGTFGIAMVFISVSTLFIDAGFGRALVQAKELSIQKINAVFTVNLIVSFVFGLGLFLSAGIISKFYGFPELKQVLKVLSVIFIFSAFGVVPSSLLARELRFRELSLASLISTAISGVAAIILSLNGWGIWSLVFQYLLVTFMQSALFFCFCKQKPWPDFSFRSKVLKPLWQFGSRLFTSSVLNTVVTRLDVLIIGKQYHASQTGFYARAQSLDSIVRVVSAGSISAVFFSTASRLQDDREALRKLFKRYLHLVSFAAVGFSALMWLVTPDAFRLLFGEKWDMAAHYFQLMAVVAFAWPVSSLMVSVIAGVGNSKGFLRLEIIKSILFGVSVLVLFWTGITNFLHVLIGVRIGFIFINAFFVRKELSVTVFEQAGTVALYIVPALLAALSVYYIPDFGGIPAMLHLCIHATCFIVLYLVLILLMKAPVKSEWQKLRSYLFKRQK